MHSRDTILEIKKVTFQKSFEFQGTYGDKTVRTEEEVEFHVAIQKRSRSSFEGFEMGEPKKFVVTQGELQTILKHLNSFPELKI